MREPIPIRPSLDDSWLTTEPQLHTFAGDVEPDEDGTREEQDPPSA